MPLSVGVFHCVGDERKVNWVLVRHVPGAKRCVVFFPGDLSDFAASPNAAPPRNIYSYSLEGLLWVLCCKFPEETIVVVKPRIMKDYFSVYVNFMLVDGMGNPRPLSELRIKKEDSGDGSGGAQEEPAFIIQPPSAAAHLEMLLLSAGTKLGEELPTQLSLVGFSKGCAVLNALMWDGCKSGFWSRVSDVHFVDAGLNVRGGFSVEDRELRALHSNVRDGFAVWIHGTPRQMQDPARPWLAEEAEAFSQRCSCIGIRVEKRSYAEGHQISLDMHFDAMRCFFTGLEDADGGDKHCGFFSSWAELALREGADSAMTAEIEDVQMEDDQL